MLRLTGEIPGKIHPSGVSARGSHALPQDGQDGPRPPALLCSLSIARGRFTSTPTPLPAHVTHPLRHTH